MWKDSVFDSPGVASVSARYEEARSAGLFARKRMKQEFMRSVLPLMRMPNTTFESLQATAPLISAYCEGAEDLRKFSAEIE